MDHLTQRNIWEYEFLNFQLEFFFLIVISLQVAISLQQLLQTIPFLMQINQVLICNQYKEWSKINIIIAQSNYSYQINIKMI